MVTDFVNVAGTAHASVLVSVIAHYLYYISMCINIAFRRLRWQRFLNSTAISNQLSRARRGTWALLVSHGPRADLKIQPSLGFGICAGLHRSQKSVQLALRNLIVLRQISA